MKRTINLLKKIYEKAISFKKIPYVQVENDC